MDLLNLVRSLYAVDSLHGYTDEDVAAMKVRFGALPAVLEEFWCAAGRTQRLHYVQDTWTLPEHFEKWEWLSESSHLILINENQGCCRAGIARDDLDRPDPPVYVTGDDETWELISPTTSEFLAAMLTYQAVWTMEHSPEEFFWLSPEETEIVRTKLDKYPYTLKGWFEMDISFYGNRPDNLLVLMNTGGQHDYHGEGYSQYQALYGGASEESYAALMEVMEGLGEPV